MAEKSVIASISQAEERHFKTLQLPALRAVVTALTPQRRQGFLLLYFQLVGSPSILGGTYSSSRHRLPPHSAGSGSKLALAGTDATPPPFARHNGSQGQTRGFSALRETAVLFVNGVVIPVFSKSAFLLSVLRHPGRLKWVRASARNCGWRIAGRDACPALPTGLVALLSAGIPPRHSDGIPQRAEQQWLFYPAFIAAPAVFRHGISFQTLPKNPDIYYTFL